MITVLDTALNGGKSAAMAIGRDGFPVIAYSASLGLKVIKCGNANCTSGNSISIVETTGIPNYSVSVAIGADGSPVIGYPFVLLNPTRAYLKLMKCGNADCGFGNSIQSLDSALLIDQQTMVIGKDGAPFIVYHGTNGLIKAVTCGDPSCSTGNVITVLDSVGPSVTVSVAIGRDSFPVISYSPPLASDTGVNFIKCRNSACNLNSSPIIIDSSGHDVSITIGSDGMPVLSYGISRALWVAKCGNTGCDSGNVLASVGTEASNVWFTSIDINSNGMPIIGYAIADALFFKQCENATCTISNPEYIIDSSLTSEIVAMSMELGGDNLPVLAYNDGNLVLKLAKCSNPACSDNPGAILPFRQRRMAAKSPVLFPTGILLPDGKGFYDFRGRRVIPLRMIR